VSRLCPPTALSAPLRPFKGVGGAFSIARSTVAGSGCWVAPLHGRLRREGQRRAPPALPGTGLNVGAGTGLRRRRHHSRRVPDTAKHRTKDTAPDRARPRAARRPWHLPPGEPARSDSNAFDSPFTRVPRRHRAQWRTAQRLPVGRCTGFYPYSSPEQRRPKTPPSQATNRGRSSC
jgi:hypothetical protein